MKILVINGPNLNLLGQREPEHYGSLTLAEIQNNTEKQLRFFINEIDLTWVQSNIEGEIVNLIQNANKNYDGIVINPGGYSHTSVAILDSLKIFQGLKVEVHLSRVSMRGDSFRQNLITAQGVDILLEGLSDLSYFIGVFTIYTRLKLKG